MNEEKSVKHDILSLIVKRSKQQFQRHLELEKPGGNYRASIRLYRHVNYITFPACSRVTINEPGLFTHVHVHASVHSSEKTFFALSNASFACSRLNKDCFANKTFIVLCQ